ncbi:MAG: NADH:flavin oxidoreductase/NADH oxidase [Cyanobacteria bacterium M_surface_7_m2_040]|nr:NADH:flavin oxidoreductase/NADH oxidase [Cyanobacteria bacterium M_surface_7_m2_040]
MGQPLLFTPLRMRGVTRANRCVLSPMVQHKAVDGQVNDYHLVHLGQFAIGRFGIVFSENCAVEPQGRVTQGDIGLWDDRQIAGHQRLAHFVQQQGSLAGLQISHVGRKGSAPRPFDPPGQLGPEGADWQPWPVVGPSALPAGAGFPVPQELSLEAIEALVHRFGETAARAERAGYDVIELHAAHGYLLAQFLSPLSNQRNDHYGGDRAGRMRLPLAIVRQMRQVWPSSKPLFVRISALDGAGGWDLDDSVAFATELKALGVDVVDCSSGGLTGLATAQPIQRSPGFQVPYAAAVRRQAGVATMAVGLILDGPQAEAILQAGDADLIAIGRQALADPHWALHAAKELGHDDSYALWPPEYGWWLHKRKSNLPGDPRA